MSGFCFCFVVVYGYVMFVFVWGGVVIVGWTLVCLNWIS